MSICTLTKSKVSYGFTPPRVRTRPPLPSEYTTILTAFAVLFSRRVWQHVQILLIGAILAPGQRTVTAILRIMGLNADKHFQNFHRVLNRAIWSSREASRVLAGDLAGQYACA